MILRSPLFIRQTTSLRGCLYDFFENHVIIESKLNNREMENQKVKDCNDSILKAFDANSFPIQDIERIEDVCIHVVDSNGKNCVLF